MISGSQVTSESILVWILNELEASKSNVVIFGNPRTQIELDLKVQLKLISVKIDLHSNVAHNT